MFTTALVFALACLAYRALTKRSRALRRPDCPPPITRSRAAGDAGEIRVQAELRRALTWLCGENFYLHPTALLLHHAPGTAFPTAEIDHLAVTAFGIFVVETKHWSGTIGPGTDADTLVRITADGTRDTRRSPVAQNRSKVAFLRSVLPGMWEVKGLGVFSSDNCLLSPALPLDLVRLSDLGHWLRAEKSRHDASGGVRVNVPEAWRAVLAVAEIDASGIALEKHRKRVSANPLISGIAP
ncbi:nuclease-related domain-containing protein [Paraburkholderia sp. BL10I2N1]|uniref:nuclease-related domain-containing protein n=1 Tax=Paraburkholderia sp. BL10I2N1 TaxID=1938796 RepID=UPI00105F2829|nr:nuclease-related domain-containing protein [Paraburkholderia sp. BL10I2N1]TDN59083.1 nuclease-like protein [Paraburkholderia sp. BL10I2N1]